MPRGIKDSGKAKAGTKTDAKTNRMSSVKTVNTEGIAQVEPMIAVSDIAKGRKPYPTHEERLAAAEKQIERLTKLNVERTVLIEKPRLRSENVALLLPRAKLRWKPRKRRKSASLKP